MGLSCILIPDKTLTMRTPPPLIRRGAHSAAWTTEKTEISESAEKSLETDLVANVAVP